MAVPVVSNPAAVRELIAAIPSRLLDVCANGDSNLLRGGYGWEHGWAAAMLDRFGATSMCATGLHGYGEGGGSGQGVGYGNSATDTGGQFVQFRSGGASALGSSVPSGITDFWDPSLDPDAGTAPNHLRIRFWRSRADPASDLAKIDGLTLGALNPLGLSPASRPLSYQAWLAKFDDTIYTAISPVRQANFAVTGSGPTDYPLAYLTTATQAAEAVVPLTPFVMDITARSGQFDVRRQDPAANLDRAYPFGGVFQRIIDKNAASGHATSAGYAVGSKTTTNCLAYWTAMEATRIANYLYALVYHQIAKGQAPNLIVTWHFGTNDATAAISKATFKSNLESLISLFGTAWGLLSLGASAKIRHIIMVAQPIDSNGSDSTLSAYREAAHEIALADAGVCAVNLAKITSYAELAVPVVPSYDTGVDVNHLLTNSHNNGTYQVLVGRALDAILVSGWRASRNFRARAMGVR